MDIFESFAETSRIRVVHNPLIKVGEDGLLCLSSEILEFLQSSLVGTVIVKCWPERVGR